MPVLPVLAAHLLCRYSDLKEGTVQSLSKHFILTCRSCSPHFFAAEAARAFEFTKLNSAGTEVSRYSQWLLVKLFWDVFLIDSLICHLSISLSRPSISTSIGLSHYMGLSIQPHRRQAPPAEGLGLSVRY